MDTTASSDHVPTPDHPVLDQSTGELSLHGRSIKLTRTEQSLLARMMRSEGQVVSRAQLYGTLYGGRIDSDCPDDKIIGVLVCKLRGKMAEIGATGVIETARGRGWRVAVTAPRLALALTRPEWTSLEIVVSLAERHDAAAAGRIRAAMRRTDA
jgi:DNA-binding response OmpR family regulator